MNKRQTRIFAIASTAIATLVFLALTLDSHRQFPQLTHSDNITDAVIRGQNVWHRKNCINCHTMLGEGAYYAPDLTKIAEHRGAPYLTAFLKDPSKFYDETRHRRLMPQQDLSDQDVKDLVAFMDWVSKVDNQGWPPRPILVTGSSIPGTDLTMVQQATRGEADNKTLPPAARPVESDNDPVALGQALFRSVSPACAACHSIAPGVNMAGPTLAGIATRAAETVKSPDYHGKAKTPEEFIHESIVEPSAYLHPGAMYSADGKSFMPTTYGKDLAPEQIDQLVAYLSTFK